MTKKNKTINNKANSLVNFSKNVKLNKVLNNIYDSLLYMHDTESESIDEIKHYMKSFPKEIDYNIYQYGNAIICTDDIHKMYSDYKTLQNCSDCKIISIYKRQIGYVARYIRDNK